MSRTCLLYVLPLCLIAATPALSAETLKEWIADGKPIINLNTRYENVGQAGFAKDAHALTLRARLGYETANYKGFGLLFDFDFIRGIDGLDHNSTINGKTAFPIIADPEGEELNQLKLTYNGIDGVVASVGRQRIVLDNARFIGNVGWRQNEQTFDTIHAVYTPVKGVSVSYGYLDKIHRIFGDDNPQGNWESDSHIVHASYTGINNLTLTGYGYILDFASSPINSNATYGIRASGSLPAGGVTIGYTGEYAHQTDHGQNPVDYKADYYLISASLGAKGLTGSVTLETLTGNGSIGFATPLATLHLFQGWADVFLTTPANGIEDWYGQLSYNFSAFPALKGLAATIVYHDFSSENGGGSLGEEIDAQISYKISSAVTATLKHAHYNGPTGGPASRNKTWVQLIYNY